MGKLLYLTPLGLVSLAVWRLNESLVLVAGIMVVWIGLALAAKLRPSILAVVGDRRAPTGGEWGAVLIGLLIAYLGFGAVDQFFSALKTGSFGLENSSARAGLIANLLATAWVFMAIAPALAAVARSSVEPADRTRRAVSGLGASVPIGFGLFLAWETLAKAFVQGGPHEPLFLQGLLLAPVLALLAGFGGVVWWRALSGSAERAQGSFALAVRGAVLGWAAAGLLGVAMIALAVLHPTPDRPVAASILAFGSVVAMALTWSRALKRLSNAGAANVWRAGAAIVVLLVLFGASFIPAFAFLASARTVMGDASWLTALVMMPALVVMAALWLGAAPWLSRKIAG